MRISILSVILFSALLLFSTQSDAQIDSSKVLKIKDRYVETGKYYEVFYKDEIHVKGKLIAVNKYTFLMLINNQLEEININDISNVEEIDASNIVYTIPKPQSEKPIYSLSAGYLLNAQDANNYYYYSSGTKPKLSAFDLQGDALIKTSDNFGFRIDINYFHIFSKKSDAGYSYYNSYDSSTSRTEIEYKDVNAFTAKTGICFGSMNNNLPFNFYMFIGVGFGWLFKGDDISNYYVTKNNITKVTQSTTGSSTGFMVGIHGQIRLSYKINKKYGLFIEPTYQYWGNKIDQLYGINGGITFLL
jgi:hypothetical protein